MSEVIGLDLLPPTHELRNKPLHEIGAHYQLSTKGQMWHEVKPTFGIANKTFNELGDVWKRHHVWKATR